MPEGEPARLAAARTALTDLNPPATRCPADGGGEAPRRHREGACGPEGAARASAAGAERAEGDGAGPHGRDLRRAEPEQARVLRPRAPHAAGASLGRGACARPGLQATCRALTAPPARLARSLSLKIEQLDQRVMHQQENLYAMQYQEVVVRRKARRPARHTACGGIPRMQHSATACGGMPRMQHSTSRRHEAKHPPPGTAA